MKIVKIDNRRGSEFHAAHFISGRAGSGVVPGPDDEKIFRTRFERRVRHVVTVKCHRAQLIAIVLPGNGQNRQRHFFELLLRWHHGVVIRVGGWMLQNALKVLRRIADERVERAEGDMLLVGVEEFRPPEFRVAKKVLLARLAAGEGEPLDIVRFADVIERWIIKRRMRGGSWNNRREMCWKFLARRPLIE